MLFQLHHTLYPGFMLSLIHSSENGMEAYVKYNYVHMEQRPRFKPDPFKAENFYYNEEQDFCICPMGQIQKSCSSL